MVTGGKLVSISEHQRRFPVPFWSGYTFHFLLVVTPLQQQPLDLHSVIVVVGIEFVLGAIPNGVAVLLNFKNA